MAVTLEDVVKRIDELEAEFKRMNCELVQAMQSISVLSRKGGHTFGDLEGILAGTPSISIEELDEAGRELFGQGKTPKKG